MAMELLLEQRRVVEQLDERAIRLQTGLNIWGGSKPPPVPKQEVATSADETSEGTAGGATDAGGNGADVPFWKKERVVPAHLIGTKPCRWGERCRNKKCTFAHGEAAGAVIAAESLGAPLG
jgi:hypothetical protein